MSLPKTTDKKEVYFKKRKQAVRMLADVAYFPDWGGCA